MSYWGQITNIPKIQKLDQNTANNSSKHAVFWIVNQFDFSSEVIYQQR